MKYRFDPEGRRLPVKLDSTSNAEYVPIPLEPRNRHANALAQEAATRNARRTGLGRRAFLTSAAGAATSLLAINRANAAAGFSAGYFALEAEAELDPATAEASLGKKEFIFDVQGHYVPPDVAAERKAECAKFDYVSRDYMRCLGADDFVKDVFLDADTDMMVLSFVPSKRDEEPITIEEADATRRIVDELEGTQRLLIHGRVNPNQDGDLEGMDELAEKYQVSAWKAYTQWGPDGKGFWMTDDVGHRIRREGPRARHPQHLHPQGHAVRPALVRALSVQGHRAVAKQFPDVNFLIYHSGLIAGTAGRALRPGARRRHGRTHSLGEAAGLGKEQRLRGTRQHLARPDARHDECRARHRQTGQAPRRRERALGLRLHLVRLAPGPDPGVPHVPDRTETSATIRLPGNHGPSCARRSSG